MKIENCKLILATSVDEFGEICTCIEDKGNGNAVAANDIDDEYKNLFLSAPEMYEMLESARNELYALIDEVNDQRAIRITSTTETEPDYHDKETLYLIDSLLAKARGES